MARNPEVNFFKEDSVTGPSQFFDKVAAPDRSADASEEEEEAAAAAGGRGSESRGSKATENPDEPIVCKIFQSEPCTKPSDTDPSSFFDMLGTMDSELNHSFLQHERNPCDSSRMKDSAGDILSSFKTYDENFSKPPCMVESERSRDAWIIPESAKEILLKMIPSSPGSYVPTRDDLTMPGVILEEDLKDPVYEAVLHYFGESVAAKRKVPSATEVTQDDRGIRDLMQAGCYRAAVNLTKTLLTIYGQGAGRAGHPSKHTVHSIQLWFTRLALLVKLRSFTLAHDESEPFGDLDKPDMFFQFYPELYGGRTGSIVPFSLRLLIAQIPAFIEKHQLALTRLHAVLATIRKILSNLERGLFEDGTPGELSPEARAESVKLWSNREVRVLHSIVTCSLAFKDYSLAIQVVGILLEKEQEPEQEKCLRSALGRILLQLGDVISAEKHFASARNGLTVLGPRELNDSGLCMLAQNQYQEAYWFFEKASELDPKSITAVNNMAVCLLYLGRLKQAVFVLEGAIKKNPKLALNEHLLLNLCSLYELQTSHYSQSKLKMLMLVNEYKGDGFNIGCLKLKP